MQQNQINGFQFNAGAWRSLSPNSLSFLCPGALSLTAVGMGSADACVHRGAQRCFLRTGPFLGKSKPRGDGEPWVLPGVRSRPASVA